MRQQTFGTPAQIQKRASPITTQSNTSLKFYPLQTQKKTPEGIMDEVESIHGKKNFYALYSGGKDSSLVLNWLIEHDKLKAVVHVDTGVEMKLTRDFIKDTCKSYGIDLIILYPRPRHRYVNMVLEHGFPGPGAHRIAMGFLKFHPIREFFLKLKDNSACLVSGVREAESKRRKKNFISPIESEGKMWFVNPFFYYSNEMMYKERLEKNIPISPAYTAGMNISGDCLCGAYATYGEKDRLRTADPHLADYIAWLEMGVQKFGTSLAKKSPKWAGTSSMADLEQQTKLDIMVKSEGFSEGMENQFCGSDCGPGTMKGETDF